MSSWNSKIIDEFRANGGEVGGGFEGKPILLLHNFGARSGRERVTPLMYKGLGDDYVVFASKGGAEHNPDWFYNVKANPEVKVEVGDSLVAATARVADGEERDRIWEGWKREWPQFADYEAKTSRIIPVIVLETV